MSVMVVLAGAVLGGVVGAVATYLTTRSNMLLGLQHEYDRALRDKRLEHYQTLFHISRSISVGRRLASEPTRPDLKRIREEFTGWYFGPDAAGMFLTPAAKELYVQLITALDVAVYGPEPASDPVGTPVTAAEYRVLHHITSELRHQLAEDVGASNPPRLHWARLGATVHPPDALP